MRDAKTDAFRMEVKIRICCGQVERSGQVFNAENEKKGGKGISLPRALLAFEESVNPSINLDGVGGRIDALHDLFGENNGETQTVQNRLNSKDAVHQSEQEEQIRQVKGIPSTKVET